MQYISCIYCSWLISGMYGEVGEAIAISREQRAGTDLMNSKAEYNRCEIQRLDTRSEKEKNERDIR